MGSTEEYYRDRRRSYIQCPNCKLIFVPEPFWLTPEDEKAVYDLHENSPNDTGYRSFLSRLTAPLMERINPGDRGLDFGCGPGPTLSVMLEERGYDMALYDPIYFNQPETLNLNYNFITATEVVEHLKSPGIEFELLFRMVKKGGWLGLMTKLVTDRDAFSRWHYIQDETHICFYTGNTFEYIAEQFNLALSFEGKDVILFQKRAPW